jgi:hypothetical protein
MVLISLFEAFIMKMRVSRGSVPQTRNRKRPTAPESVKLKLVVRQSDSDDDVFLDILPPPDPEGLESHDELKDEVANFLREHFHYDESFVSVAILDESDNLADFAQRANYYGPYLYVLRNEVVLPKLNIVCCDDIQNAISNATDKNLIDSCVEKFTDLAEKRTLKMKREALRMAVIRTGKNGYAEARMPGKLTSSDVKRVYGSDGKPVRWPPARKKRLTSGR